MARGLTSGMTAEVAKKSLRPVFFVDIGVSSTTIRVWSGTGTISWNGQSWTGVGHLGRISPMSETVEPRATGIQLQLSGIPASLIGYALTEIRHGKTANVWLGLMDDAGAIIVDPYKSFSGRVDTCDIEENGETATIQIGVENRRIEQKRARIRRWTHEDQQLEYAGDKGFEYVSSLQELILTWGRRNVSLPSCGETTDGPQHPPGGYYPS